MSFCDLDLKHSYSSEKDDLLENFYIPVLSEAVQYKRITGYFSSTSFLTAAAGLTQFIKNNGKMQFILNVVLSNEDYDQIDKGIQRPEEIIGNRLIEDLDTLEDECRNDHVRVLGWLIANGYLEVKIGYIREKKSGNEILHQKIGILTDKENNTISFSGSNNESAYGWAYNSEKFKVFFSWVENNEIFISEDLEDFEELWNNQSKRTEVISFPEAVLQKVIFIVQKEPFDVDDVLMRIAKHQKKRTDSSDDTAKTQTIRLRDYQHEAIDAWFRNGCRGIFEMATGTGKTYTALGALKELLQREPKLVTIVSAPFLHLAKQWEKSLQNMDTKVPVIHVSSANPKWREELGVKVLNNRLGKEEQFIILTTHDSLSSESFTDLIHEVRSPILLIGDEVHGLGAVTRIEALLPLYSYRLGLSATPERYFDELGTHELMRFFDKVVYTFDLHRAINEVNPDTGETFLTPYEYHPIFVELTYDDMELYSELNGQIAILSHKENKSKKEQLLLEQKLRERQDILKNTSTKYPAFERLLTKMAKENEIKHTLVYCSPQQIQTVQKIIRAQDGVVQHRFTSNENATIRRDKYQGLTEREFLLSNFDKGNYDILVAIRCLDEGVDVPSTRNAILMCSSGNPKEYIQRRGRVLRRYPGKDKAVIYDITAVPNSVDGKRINTDVKMLESQLKRLEEFEKDALNETEISAMVFEMRKKYCV